MEGKAMWGNLNSASTPQLFAIEVQPMEHELLCAEIEVTEAQLLALLQE